MALEAFNVGWMKACSGFIEDVKRLAALAPLEFSGEFDTLGFSARELGGGLTKTKITKTYFLQNFEGANCVFAGSRETCRSKKPLGMTTIPCTRTSSITSKGTWSPVFDVSEEMFSLSRSFTAVPSSKVLGGGGVVGVPLS